MGQKEFAGDKWVWYTHWQGGYQVVDQRLYSHNLKHVLTAIAEGSRLDIPDEDGQLPIHSASWFGQDQVVAALIKAGSPLDTHCGEGDLPIHNAVRRDQIKSVKLLLQAGSPLDIPDGNGDLPIHISIDRIAGQPGRQITKLLIRAGSPLDRTDKYAETPIYQVARWGHPMLVSALLEAGATPIMPSQRYNFVGDLPLEYPPLHKMLLNHDLSGVHDAIETGSQVNLAGPGGLTPLMIASANAMEEEVQCLLSAGARVNDHNIAGNTALHMAVIAWEDAIARHLIAAGADPTIKNNEGESPAMIKMKLSRPQLFSNQN
jgi:ankyrin repeat protein